MSIQLIAEIGSNWEGDVELAKKHIKKSKECGASFVKFQMWRANDLYDDSHPYWNFIQKTELTENIAKELKNYADKVGIKWFCSVFYPEAVDVLESIDIQMYKIASSTAALKDKFAQETIQRVAETKKLTFVSTGEGADKELISKIFQGRCKFTYCVSKYLTLDSEINWKEIINYNFFSDHTLGITIPIVFSILKKPPYDKKIFIEKHVKFDSSKGPDSDFAITYNDLTELAEHVERLSKLNLST